MSNSPPLRPRGKYGIDAPWVPWLWLGIGAVGVALAVFCQTWGTGWWVVVTTWYFVVLAVLGFIGAALFWHASLRGKFVIWNRMLRRTVLPDRARVLDLGCGHAAVAIMVAQRFPTATVTGIDLWRSIDQSGNSIEAARRNVELNRVGDRVKLDTGDMTKLPYTDGSFDLVTASLSIHNIPTPEGRREAIREAVRVLAPRGRILVADIQRIREYEAELRALGFSVTGPSRLGWRGWWSGPWMSTSELDAVR
ncbi:class I SAM-dependent methyltransferase [Microbacterium deminutum]|uniref:Class I SAM-dependent methyltransferase n=1 Tax=Microbacterium deminutum TaxID=344164 RepID=A0ABP5CAM8_9MICO